MTYGKRNTPNIWVPQPASLGWSAQGGDPQSTRQRFIDHYGQATVERAELSVVLDVLVVTGIIKPSEFIDLIGKKLHRLDEQRRSAAGLESDRG